MPEDTTASSQSEALLLRDPNLHVIFGVTLMAVLGVSSITPAFPQIAVELQLSPGAVGLLVAIFTLPGATLTPVLGVLGDRIGRKRVLIPSLFLFAVAGTACGFAREFETLLWLRLLQGMGAAALGALNITIVGDLYSGWKRATVMGYNASVLSVGTALYPAIGGALALIGWFYPFFLPILAVPVALLVLWRLKNPEPSRDEKLSTYLRNTLISVRNPRALGLFLASLVIFVVLYGAYLTYLPFLLRLSFDASPLLIGLMFSATSLATAVTSWRLGRLARRFSERNLVRLGFAFYAVAMIAIPLAPSVGLLLLPALLFGATNGISIPSILSMLTGLAPAEYRAAFMSVNAMTLRLGQTLGPVVAGLMLQVGGLAGIYYGNAILSVATLGVVSAVVKKG
ncbi:MAG: MFS transporter [Gemmatimonadetes bacterium]|nr:MFS transporter [Gemmatimonadota bacterium]NIO32184.1 MFS transporter [Gemmatimonadota bacterium]